MSESKVSAETLTDEERLTLSMCGTAAAKALRIIDARTAALEAERAKREHSASDWKVQVEAAESRAEALQAEVARLTAALEAADEENGRLQRKVMASDSAAEAAESRAEALQARVAELEAQNAPDYDPITAAVPDGDMNGPHGDIPCRPKGLKAETAKARVAELEADRERRERDWVVFRAERAAEADSLRRAESELADLRGRVERAEEWLTSAWISNAKRVSLAWEALRGR